MPISATGGNATQFNPASMVPSASGNPNAAMPGVSMPAAPSFNFNTPSASSTSPDYSHIVSMLTRNPTSLTNTVMPYLQSLFGQQGSMASRIFSQQGSQGAAQAQSDAMRRGLTGSSIESSAMQGAYSQANQGYDQFMMNALGNLGQSYLQTAGVDVGQQNQMYQNLAQAMGQQMSAQTSQDEFNRQLQAGLSAAGMNANATQNAGIFQGIGSGIAGLAAFSDIRLKKNVRKIGQREGLDVYSFEYDRERAPELDLPPGRFVGYMAHHIADRFPEAVSVVKGYLSLDYSKLPAMVEA